jgi:uncharacterized protein YecE (DUF72 family)
MTKAKNIFYCGTSNVALPVPNKASFPAKFQGKSRLTYYASLFNTIEINASFKKIPLQRTVERWARETPVDFRFTFKFFGGITHAKLLDYDRAHIDRFFDAVNIVGEKKACVLIQFPASIKAPYFEKIATLLTEIRSTGKAKGWKLAIEFRDSSWYQDRVYKLLERYNAAIVTHDMPKSATPALDVAGDLAYVRFHGDNGRYRGSYSDEVLSTYADSINYSWAQGKEVFVYFNNTMGDAAKNALALKALLR